MCSITLILQCGIAEAGGFGNAKTKIEIVQKINHQGEVNRSPPTPPIFTPHARHFAPLTVLHYISLSLTFSNPSPTPPLTPWCPSSRPLFSRPPRPFSPPLAAPTRAPRSLSLSRSTSRSRARYMPQNPCVMATKGPSESVFVFDYTKARTPQEA